MEIKGAKIRIVKERGADTEVYVTKDADDGRGAVNFSTHISPNDNLEAGLYTISFKKESEPPAAAAKPEEPVESKSGQ